MPSSVVLIAQASDVSGPIGMPNFTAYGVMGLFLTLVVAMLGFGGWLVVQAWKHNKDTEIIRADALKEAEAKRQAAEEKRDATWQRSMETIWEKMRVHLDHRDKDIQEMFEKVIEVQHQTGRAVTSLDSAVRAIAQSNDTLKELVYRSLGVTRHPPAGEPLHPFPQTPPSSTF